MSGLQGELKRFRIEMFIQSSLTMTPEKTAELKTHLDAIAQLLYDESDPAELQTLEAIELTVREKIQAHVSPELGSFLSAVSVEPKRAASDD